MDHVLCCHATVGHTLVLGTSLWGLSWEFELEKLQRWAPYKTYWGLNFFFDLWKNLMMWRIKLFKYTGGHSLQGEQFWAEIRCDSWDDPKWIMENFGPKKPSKPWVSVWAVAKMRSQDMAGPCAAGNKDPVIKGGELDPERNECVRWFFTSGYRR